MDPVRLSIGDVTLVRVPYADILVDAEVVGLTPEQVRANGWSAPIWSEGEQVRVGAAVWIIESDGQRIVVDPAQAADEILRTGTDASFHQQAVAEVLASAGFARESIDTVIATHIDGIGMMAWADGDEWSPFFPNANVLISRLEHEAIVGDGPYFPSGAAAYVALHEQGAVTTVEDGHAVTPAVTIRWTGAHSPGHQVVDIASQGDEATMIGHLALSPLHWVIGGTGPHVDPVAADAVLQLLGADRLLVGPLWPAPGAARRVGDRVQTADI